MPELPELLLPGPAADDEDAALLAMEVDAVDAELALFSRDVFMLVDLGVPKLTLTLPPPAPTLLPPLALKENIGWWPRSTSRLEDGPPSSTEDDEEWLAPPGNASECRDRNVLATAFAAAARPRCSSGCCSGARLFRQIGHVPCNSSQGMIHDS